MAITITNNLYPPIFQSSYAPAFIISEDCKIYFSLSEFNDIEDLASNKPLQITVRNQDTNQNVLSIQNYPSEIKLSDITQEGDKYYFTLSNSDIQGGFQLNTYYKIQIRFTGAGAAAPPENMGINNWLSQNIQFFSEWSTVLLIYGISTPVLSIKKFTTESSPVIFDNINVPVIGNVSFGNGDKETLRSYQIILYDNNQIIENSQIIYSTNNQINYTFSYNFEYDKLYTMKIRYKTKNLYSNYSEYDFKVQYITPDEFKVVLNTQPIEDSGCVKLSIRSQGSEKENNYFYEGEPQNKLTGKSIVLTLADPNVALFKKALLIKTSDVLMLSNNTISPLYDLRKGTKIILRRTSSKDYFKKWDTICEYVIQHDLIVELIWYDCTVEPGIWYKYEVVRYKEQSGETFISSITTEHPTMVYTDDMFLTAEGQQLKIKYNPQLSNFSIKVSEALVETIGSPSPYIRRNGNTYYKTFSISGTISYFMNLKDNLFVASKKELYGNDDIVELYDNYNKENHISAYKDFIQEREFRNKVIEFLYKDNIKLFRSLTEGNVLVKLMNISLTPNNNLGRLIYDFSCTAYEIDKNMFENYVKYNTIINKSKEVEDQTI